MIALMIFLLIILFFHDSQGDVHNHEDLVKAIKQVDVVISTVGVELMAEQHKIISAIKEAGNVKVINLTN